MSNRNPGQRGSNTTSSQINAIITFFESNKAYFNIVIERNTDTGNSISKKQVYDALFTSLTQDQLVLDWRTETTKKRVNRIFSKFKEVFKISNAADFRLSPKDIRKGITTKEDKLEALCPCYSRLFALFGEIQDPSLYSIPFHSPPDAPENTYTTIQATTAAAQRQQVSRDQEASTEAPPSLVGEVETTDNAAETSAFATETLGPVSDANVLHRSTISRSRALSISSSSDDSMAESEISYLKKRMDRDFCDEYREVQRQRLISKNNEIKRTRSLGVLNATLEAIRTKTFGDVPWREVARNVKIIDAMVSSDDNILPPEDTVSVNNSADEYEEGFQ